MGDAKWMRADRMPNIEIGLDQRHEIEAAHVEYTQQTGAIEPLVEGPPVFSGAAASGWTLIVTRGFADFLESKGIPFEPA